MTTTPNIAENDVKNNNSDIKCEKLDETVENNVEKKMDICDSKEEGKTETFTCFDLEFCFNLE